MFEAAVKLADEIKAEYGDDKDFKGILENLDLKRNGKKVLVCISGFLSQKDDLKNHWKDVLKVLDKDIQIYGYKWPAKHHQELIEPAIKRAPMILSGAFDTMSIAQEHLGEEKEKKEDEDKTSSLASLFSWKTVRAVATLAYGVSQISSDYAKIFRHARDTAIIYGKFLAYTIILASPFVGKRINLLGFSLGCQVIKSCLDEL